MKMIKNNGKKPKFTSNAFIRLGAYLWKFKGYAFLAIFLVIVSNVLAIIAPSLSGKAIDAIGYDSATKTANVDFEVVIKYCLLMIVCFFVSAVLSYILSKVMIVYSQKVRETLRDEIFGKLLELPVGYFDQLQAGDIISRISYDVDTVNTSLANDLLLIFNSILTILGALFYMIKLSPKMLLIFLVTVPMSVFVTAYRTKKVKPLFRKRSAYIGKLNGHTEEILSGIKTIKVYGRQKEFHKKYDDVNQNTVDACYSALRESASIGPATNFVNNLSISIISVAGASLYVAGAISLGDISSFILYSRKVSGPINEFANIIADLQSCRSAADRIFTIIDEFPEREDDPDAISLDNVTGEIKFDHVKFSYIPEREIIHDLSVTAPAGKTIAIVGPTGGGKTTIVNLLMRFYDYQSGNIFLDGTRIDKIKRRDLRRAFTMVLQETWLFNGTVKENIAYGKEGAADEEITAAAKACDIHDFIMSLPNGYDTYLTDGGLNISKGQKQLLTIARAMLSDAKILILDEATSNIDTRTEQKIESAMLKLMHGKTSFVIAHRLSTVRDADVIMVVKDGDVVEIGTHKELLSKEGFYSELYFSQFN